MKRFAQKGYSVVEVLLAGALFAIVAGGVVTAVIYAQRTNESAFARQKALRIAEEGVEAVRSIRQRDYDLLVNAPVAGLRFDSNQWEIVYYPTDNDDVTADGFRRRLVIEDGPTTFSKSIEVSVDYITGGQVREVSLETIVSDLNDSDTAVNEADGQDRLVSNNYIIQNDSQSPGALQDLVVQSVNTIGGVEFWYAADQNISLSEVDQATLWYDLSGNDRHAVQADSFSRPTWEDGVINGYPALQFDGENDAFELPTMDLNGFDGMTVLAVTAANADLDPADGNGEYGAFFFNGGGNGKLYLSPQQGSLSYKIGANTSQNEILYTRPSNIGSAFTLTGIVKDRGDEELFVDGVSVNTEVGRSFPSGDIDTSGSIARESDFGNTYFNGYIAELIVFNKALTTSEYSTVQTYLNDKYSIF